MNELSLAEVLLHYATLNGRCAGQEKIIKLIEKDGSEFKIAVHVAPIH